MGTNIVTCPHCGQRNRVPAAASGKPRCRKCNNWLPWVTTAGDGDFTEVVEKNSAVPVLVDLWATWCAPCRIISPALEQLATRRAGQLKLVKVDVDTAPGVSQRFTVRAVPTLLLFDNGQVLARGAGAAPLAALQDWLDQALDQYETKETG
jgi:thioredoxin 2